MTTKIRDFLISRRSFLQQTAMGGIALSALGNSVFALRAKASCLAENPACTYSGFAVDIYCAPTDLGTGDGSSEANAMALIDALALTHAPGTVLGALPGNYQTAYNHSGLTPSWQIASNGASGQPIRVVAKYSAVYMTNPVTDSNASRLRHTGMNTSTSGIVVGGFEKEYQQWWGFLADENHGFAGTDGAVAHWRSSVGCAFHRMRIIAITTDPGLGSDNHSGIGVRDCQDIVLADNKISGFNHSSHHNHNGILRYDTAGLTIRNNEIFDCSSGIYLKDSPAPYPGGQDEAAYFNLIRNCKTGIEIACASSSAPDYSSLYQNIIVDCSAGIGVTNDTVRVRVYNNTIVLNGDDGGEGGCVVMNFAGADTECRDNILVQRGGQNVNNQRYRDYAPAVAGSNYNRYYSTGTYRYRYDGANRDNLADWQALTSTDANSSQGNPQFVNLSTNDFHLSSGSPCLTMSSTAGPVGAYITGAEIIGVTPSA